MGTFAKDTLAQPKKSADTQKRYAEYAKAMLRKDARINTRLPSKCLRGLQAAAVAEGSPDQTLVARILHRDLAGRFHANNDV